jgi:crossover junction endodeoxyribonuclease RusA
VNLLAFTAYGKPAAQGSKIRTKYALRDSNDQQLTPWRNSVSLAAHLEQQGRPRISEPVHVTVAFYFDRPKAHYRTGRNADLLRNNAPAVPTRVGDIDKLCRALLDGITDSGVWTDDSLVTRLTAEKRWTDTAMPSPGAVVEITTPTTSQDTTATTASKDNA